MAVRTVVVAFSSITLILIAVVLVLALQLRDRATQGVVANLEAGRRMVTTIHERRARSLERRGEAVIAELQIGRSLVRRNTGASITDGQMRAFADVVERQVQSLDGLLHVDAVVVVDRNRLAVARAGRDFVGWPIGWRVGAAGDPPPTGGEQAYVAAGVPYRVVVVPVRMGPDVVGEVHLATALDQEYAEALSALTRTPILMVAGAQQIACTLPDATCRQFAGQMSLGPIVEPEMAVAGEDWAVASLFRIGDTVAWSVDSLTGPRRAADREAWVVLGTFGLVLILLGGAASLWLARTLSRPLDDLSRTLSEMATSRRFTARIPRPGTSRELDALTDTFNELMRSLTVAEGETRSAYVGAIRALAVALDARDPYTAGHSERVSVLAAAIGRQMALPEREMDVLRLGALLHDIGKIGVSDNVLSKPGPLSPEEFEAIKTHTRVGARILRPVPFLAPHLAMVELHHERPDGKGYPHGLLGDEIPPLARIVRVADAFDAMTTARAYRPARAASEALAELWRHAGTQFDTAVVEALASAWPALVVHLVPDTVSAPGPLGPPRPVLPFSARSGLTRS